jgi:hypothetical protein
LALARTPNTSKEAIAAEAKNLESISESKIFDLINVILAGTMARFSHR